MAIINSWSFMAFAKSVEAKKVFTANFTSSETGEDFRSIVLKKSASRDEKGILVNFSKNLKDISDADIIRRKDELQVVQIEVKPEVLANRKAKGKQLESFILCEQGESSWNELDLGL